MDWFKTPGNTAFIESIDEDIRQGCSIILQTPKSIQSDVIRAMEQFNEHGAKLHWLPFNPGEGKPIDELCKLFYGASHSKGKVVVSDLYKSKEFRSSIVVVNDIEGEELEKWITFLLEIAQYNQNVPNVNRTSILLLTSIGPNPVIKREELLLKCRIFNGITDSWDMMIYAYYLMKNSMKDPIKKQLIASLCTELSLWDYQLCAQLVNQDLSTLLNPNSILIEYAVGKRWDISKGELNIDDKWRLGICQSFCGANELHSAYLAQMNINKKIAYRLWKAEISVLFPQLEIKRQKLLRQFAHLLRVPHSDSNGAIIENIEDLEIGHIEYQLSRIPQVEKSLIDRLDKWRSGRNSLAHMEPTSLKQAFSILESF